LLRLGSFFFFFFGIAASLAPRNDSGGGVGLPSVEGGWRSLGVGAVPVRLKIV
jgi:hypothetical protein